jgi:hypothetical protein
VVIEHLASEEMRAIHPELDDVDWVELLDRGPQGLISGALWDLGPDFDKAMDLPEARIALLRGVRPFMSFVNPAGTQLYVRVMNDRGGWGTPIPIDLEVAGANFMENNPNFND